ncbi:hypothetical protein KVR01_002966 [Diaporthe batatas]|uniref:uncharacterized protein n=1 Tax=Diaporthe batatas TaxID=748121 RepID=UPI001D03BD24|nr:uncharacterized protein KVR01_002966 [Diaporthe batatas]KAG8167277.1 hypothetical protein KVR01_002966 [Diaporthe batatas]
MALWPFRRRSRRKRPRSGNQSEGEGASRGTPEDQARARSRRKTEPINPGASDPLPTAPIPIKRQPNKLHRRERTYSFEEGRDDDLVVHRQRPSRKTGAGVSSQGPVGPRVHSRSKETGVLDPSDPSVFNSANFPRMPTLHNKRNGEHLPHKKSSKRRKADHAREQEIKALASFEPMRPAAEPWQSGRPMKRDSRRVKTGLGLGFRRSWEKEHPTSDISLPMPGSIHSSLSSDSEQVSFKVSALEALAPRPTLKYAVYPRYGTPPTASGRHLSVKNKLSEKEPIPEATLKAHKRIDDLADDLTASDLRELMERDERRRAKKREREQERMERRLARRAEKERAAKAEGRQSPPNMERGVLGRESVGLGIGPESAVVTSSKKRRSPSPTAKALGKRPAADMEDDYDSDGSSSGNRPLDHFHRTDSVPLDRVSVVNDSEQLEGPRPERTESPRKKIALMKRISRSKSPHPSEPAKTDVSDSLRKVSEGSSGPARPRRSWTNLFRWGSRSKRNSGPSSFSNTSRDSMSANHVPAPPISDALTRKLSSNVPKRTMSRFREDLPELPLSPPHSPDADPLPPAIIEQDSPELEANPRLEETLPKRRDTPMSPEEGVVGSVPPSVPTSVGPSPEPQAMSLNSVDSEGAWFGKRMTPRRSIPTPISPPRFEHHRTSSMSSDGSSHHDPDLPTQEILDESATYVEDDEYLDRFANHRSSDSHATNARPSSDDIDDPRWGTVGGQQPKVVAGDFVRSREGLLNTFSDADDASDLSDDDIEINNEDENGLKRATSITRQKGNAKLLQISPRHSDDARRRASAN